MDPTFCSLFFFLTYTKNYVLESIWSPFLITCFFINFKKNKKGNHRKWWKFMFIKFKTTDAIDAVLLLLLLSSAAFIRSSKRIGYCYWIAYDALTCFINIHILTVSSRYVSTFIRFVDLILFVFFFLYRYNYTYIYAFTCCEWKERKRERE